MNIVIFIIVHYYIDISNSILLYIMHIIIYTYKCNVIDNK